MLLLLFLFSFRSLILDLFFLPRSTSLALSFSLLQSSLLSLDFSLSFSIIFTFFSFLNLPISHLVLSSSSNRSQSHHLYCILFLPHSSLLMSSPSSDSSPLLPSQNFNPFFLDHRLSRYLLCQSLLSQAHSLSRSKFPYFILQHPLSRFFYLLETPSLPFKVTFQISPSSLSLPLVPFLPS